MSTKVAISIWSYEGRSSRTDYFFVLLITSVLGGIAGSLMIKGGALGFFSGLLFVATLWVSLCACARRMHDLGNSGWWTLVAFVPVANFVLGLYALFARGQDHDNEYGAWLSPSPSPMPSQSLPVQAASAPASFPPRSKILQSPLASTPATNAEVITPIAAGLEAVKVEPMEEFWAYALHECDSAVMKPGLWAKAFADADGDERVAKATYMRLRATQLQNRYDEQQQALKLARDLELQAEQERQKIQDVEVAELLGKMNEVNRAEALIPKGKCPACDAVIPLVAEQCPKCTALFTEDSNWRVTPLSSHEALLPKGADDGVIRSTRATEEKDSNNAQQVVVLGVLLALVVLTILISQ